MDKIFVKKTMTAAIMMSVLLLLPMLPTKAAATKKVYLVTTWNENDFTKMDYKYDKNGLLRKKIQQNDKDHNDVNYSYRNGLLTKVEDSFHSKSIRYNYDEKKRIKEVVYWDRLHQDTDNEVFTYNAEGRISESVMNYQGYTTKNIYSYGDKGRISKIVSTTLSYDKTDINNSNPMYDTKETNFEYDNKGNLTRKGNASYENHYNKNGCLVKRIKRTDTSSPSTYKYSYTMMEIPTKNIAAVRTQQNEILLGKNEYTKFLNVYLTMLNN